MAGHLTRLKTIRCVVFDFDGTLVRSNRIKRQALYDCTRDVAGAANLLDRMHGEGLPGDRYDIFRELSRRLGQVGADEAGRLVTGYTALCKSRLAACEQVPGAIEAVSALSRDGLALYIASATPEQELRDIVAERGLGDFFADIFGRPTGKTDHLRRIIERCAFLPGEMLMVGDGLDDQAAAAAVGCRFVAVLDDPISLPDAADAFVDDLQGLPALVEDLSRGAVRRKKLVKEDCR